MTTSEEQQKSAERNSQLNSPVDTNNYETDHEIKSKELVVRCHIEAENL